MWRYQWVQKIWSVFGSASIQIKVLGIVVGVIVLLGLFVTLQLRWTLYMTLEEELHKQGLGISDSIARSIDALMTEDEVNLVEYLDEVKAHYSAGGHNTLVDYILITDSANRTLSMTSAGIPDRLPAHPVSATNHERVVKLATSWGDVIDVTMPLANGQLLRLGLAEDNIEHISNAVSLQIFSITLVMILVGFVAAIFLTWILTRPIMSLVSATRAVANGDFSQQVTRWANDELGELADAFNAMTSSLAHAARERNEREALRKNYIREVIAAQEEERKRIARELHDSTSQSLTSLLVGLRNLEGANDFTVLRTRIDEIRKVVNDTLEEVHTLAWQLRPNVLDDMGLSTALQQFIEDYEQRLKIKVDFVVRGLSERLPLALETGIYRMVQEGLTNIARHAKAQNASVLIEQRPKGIRVIIEDNGQGFDAEAVINERKSLGLRGIRERTALFEGKLTIESQPGQGTSLFIELPFIHGDTEG